MRIYLAGPMTGYPHFNAPAFDAATARLRAAGHLVFNPADNDRLNGFEPIGATGDAAEAAARGFDLRVALKQDLSWICDHAEALVLLEGWERSKGVRAEMALAEALGIPKYEMERLPETVAA